LRVGVVLRLEAQGLMESTADARYDFSVFLSPVPGAMARVWPNGRPKRAKTCLQTLLDVGRKIWQRAALRPNLQFELIETSANVPERVAQP
jgi:hypothetical protein